MATEVYVNNPLAMRFLIQYVSTVSDQVKRASGEAMVEMIEIAYKDAVERAKVQFNNTPGRVRTGGLMNAIWRGYDPQTGKGFLGVQSPYGRILELGGPVRPVDARHLWVKNWQGVPNAMRRMSPREWMTLHKADPRHYPFFAAKDGKPAAAAYVPDKTTPPVIMFSLRDEVTLESRPYISPAVDAAYAQFPAIMQRRLEARGRIS